MKIYKSLFSIVIFLLLLHINHSIDSSDIIINSISNSPVDGQGDRYSSLGGSLTFYVKGTGFDLVASNNYVFIGGYQANVLGVNDVFLIFESIVLDHEAILPVTIFVVNSQTQVKKQALCLGDCRINYSWWRTTELYQIKPRSAAPSEYINIYGNMKFTSTLNIDSIKMGPFICDRVGLDDLDLSPGTNFINCRVAIELVAGEYSADLKVLSQGYSTKYQTFDGIDSLGNLYDFRCIPQITAVGSNIGSPKGQILNIQGFGFSNNITSLKVIAGDYPCTVLTADLYSITCKVETTALNQTLYFMGSGIERWVYNGYSDLSTFAKKFWANNVTATLLSYSIYNSLDRIPVDDTVEAYIVEAWKAFFRAPETGDYKFYLAADDNSELWLSNVVNSSNTTNLQKIAYYYSYTAYGRSDSNDSLRSALINLQKGGYYLLNAFRNQGSGASHMWVGVEVPHSGYTPLQADSIQKINITYTPIREVMELKVNNYKGIYQFKIVVSLTDPITHKQLYYAETATMNYNIAASDLQARIANDLGWGWNTVIRVPIDSAGNTMANLTTTSNTGYKYTITFTSYRAPIQGAQIVPTIKKMNSNDYSVSIAIATTIAPSPPISGYLTLSFNGTSYQIPGNASDITSFFNTIPGLNKNFYCETHGSSLESHYYLIRFGGLNNTPIMSVANNGNENGLTGGISTPTVIISEIMTSSNKIFYDPLPNEFLFTTSSIPQITVSSDGILGKCNANNCSYVIDIPVTPQLDSYNVTSTGLSLTISNYANITINASSIDITFAGSECVLPSTTLTLPTFTCKVSLNTDGTKQLEAGSYLPLVHFDGIGYSTYATALTNYNVSVNFTSYNNTNGGSSSGGQILTVTGGGFPLSKSSPSTVSVTIGGAQCDILQISNQNLVIRTPAKLSTTSTYSMIVTVNGLASSSSNTYTYSDTLTPSIAQLTPATSSPSQKAYLKITGTSFGSNSNAVQVFLFNSTNSSIFYQLSLVNITSTEIWAILGGGKIGQYKLRLYIQGVGYSVEATTGSSSFSYDLSITGISPSGGSIYGGTLITFTGNNFSPINNQNQVFIGDGLNNMCDIVSSNMTTLICQTRYAPSNCLGSPQTIYITQRVQDQATCKISNGAGCIFNFDYSISPNVTSPSSVTAYAGDNVTLTGSGLSPNTNGFVWIQFYNGSSRGEIFSVNLNVKANSNSDTTVTFTMPALREGVYNVNVLVDNKGWASLPAGFTITTPIAAFGVILNDSTLNTTRNGSKGGLMMTLIGNGFYNESIYIEVSLTYGVIYSMNQTAITFSTGPLPSYLNYVIDVYRNSSWKYSCANCSVTANATKTITLTSHNATANMSSSFILQGLGTNLNMNVTSIVAKLDVLDTTNKFLKDSFVGTISAFNSTAITLAFSNIPMGVYYLNLLYSESGFAYFTTATYKTITVLASSLTATSVTTSYMGGNTLKVTGTGLPKDWSLPSKNNITVCGSLCPFLTSDSTSVSCTIPQILTSTVLSTYNLYNSANVQQTNYAVYSDNSSQQVYINDNKLNKFYDSGNPTCYVTFDFGSNFQLNITQIQYYPAVTKALVYYFGLKFQASNDNITYLDLFSMDPNMKTGWNTWNANISVPTYRYIRLAPNATQNISRCNIAEVKFYGQLLYTGAPSCNPVVQLNGNTFNLASTTVTYAAANTPKVTTISPLLGPTSGGTAVTITGTGFGTVTNNVAVVMDGIVCSVTFVTDTSISCTTQARPTFVQSSTVITVSGSNAVLQTDPFLYIDRWSNASTWGGESPPRDGDSVYIPAGQNVLVDVSTPILYTVIIEGTMIFEDGTDKTFDAYYLVCMQGSVQIGTLAKPFLSKLTITMHGRKWYPAQLPEYGNKVWAFHQGTLDMHGKPTAYTYTVLSKTAEVGDQTISVNDTVDWSVNDKIAIASTDFNHNHSEYRVITAISSKTLTLDSPLHYRHYSQVETYGTTKFPMQAEVAMLSRNIVFQGSTDEVTDGDKYGAHIMFHMQGAIGRISYTEFTNVGQGFIIGRYPMHFHMIDDASDSYCIGNAVHHSWARVVAIHDSHYLTVQKNVGYRIYGHSFFIEDGIETNNLFEDNLVISTIQIWTLINTDVTAASYWITNPNNIVRRNRAAGGDWFGFWFKLENRVTGPSSNPNICPDGVPLGEFSDNLAHSYFQGLRITEYVPRQYPCILYDADVDFQTDVWFQNNPPVHVIFSDFTAYKNFEYGLYVDVIGSIEFKNFLIAESRLSGIHISQTNYTNEDQALVNGAIIVGLCENNTEDDSFFYQRAIGFTTPRTDFLLVNNVSFYNFSSSYNMSAFLSCAVCWHPKLKITGGKTTKFNKLSFSNVDQKIIWQGLEKEIYNDLDGSFTGSGAPGWITKYYPHLDGINECSLLNSTIYDDSVVCVGNVQIRSVMFRNPIPNEMYRGLEIRVLRIPDINYNISLANDTNFTRVAMYKIKIDTVYTWDICFVTGYIYNVHWQNGNLDWIHMNFYPSPVWKPTDKGIVLRFNYTDYKEDYLVQVHKWGGTILNATRYNETNTTLDPVADNFTLGDYILLNKSDLLELGINGKQNGTLDVDTIICKLYCPVLNNTNVTVENFIRKWSNATMWPNQTLPQQWDVVVIPPEWVLDLDIDPPVLDKLIIDGELQFDTSRSLSTLTATNIWVRKGNLTAGNSSYAFPGQIVINMTANRSSDAFIVDPNYSFGSNSIIVTGSLRLYGNVHPVTWTKLYAIAQIGDTIITFVDNVDWQVGDVIVIAPTESDTTASETRTITSKLSPNSVLLDQPLSNFHYGDSSVTYTSNFGGVLDMRAGVGLLNRNIKITSNPANNWGVNVIVYQFTDIDTSLTLRGYAEIEGVEISYGGHPDTERGSFDIKYISNQGPQTFFRYSSIHDGIGWGYNSLSSQNMTIYNNVFFNCEKFLTRALYTTNFTYQSNLLVAPRKRNLAADTGLYDMVAGLDMYEGYAPNSGSNTFVTQNLVQGGDGNGFVLAGQACGEKNLAFINNSAQSVYYAGLILYQNNSQCFELTDFSVSKSTSGVLSNFNGQGLSIQRMILAENVVNSRVWMGNEADDITLSFTNIDFLALARPNCANCYTKDTCSNMRALLVPIVQIAGKHIPIDKPYPEAILSQCTDGAFDSKLVMTNINFVNYKLSYASDANINYRNCSNNILFDQGAVPDQSSRVWITNGYAKNSETEAFFSLQEPPQNFLFWRGGCGDFNCSGNKNWILNDLDGKFLGQIGQVIPQNLGISSSNCVDRNTWDARLCSGVKFGMLEFQNDGPDQRLRIVAPVNATSSTGKNTLNEWREWKWLGPEPLDQRLARFNGMIQVNASMYLEFEGVVPEELKLKLETYGNFWYSVISIRYERPNVIEVWNLNTGVFIQPYRKDQNMNLSNLALDPNNCGLNIYDPDNTTIQFILNNRPGCTLKVRTVDSVRITMHLEVSIDDFFKNNGVASFIDKISTFLHIDMSTIRIAKILSGSTYVNYFIVDGKPLTNSTSALDSNVSNYSNQTTPAQMAAYNNLLQLFQNYTNLLQLAVNNGSLKILNSSILDMTSTLLVSNPNGENSWNNNGTIDPNSNVGNLLLGGEDSKLMIILLATLIPGFTLFFLFLCCCLKNKEGVSLMKMAFDYSMTKKEVEVTFNQELINQSRQNAGESDRWKDAEAPFDDNKDTNKKMVPAEGGEELNYGDKYLKHKN